LKFKGKILITGASGFIGGHLIAEMQKREIDFICLCRDNSSLPENIPAERIAVWKSADRIQDLVNLIQRHNIEGVTHLASKYLAAHQPGEIDDLINSNVLYGTKILEALTFTGSPQWFLNIGTFWQHYDNNPYSPVNLYAATKQAFEDMAKYYVETKTLNFVTLKICDTFGANDPRRKLFSLWKETLGSKEPLQMSGGEQYMDISPVENVIDAILHCAQELSMDTRTLTRGESYFLHSGNPMRLRELAALVESVIGETLNIQWRAKEYRSREIFVPIQIGKSVPEWLPPISLKDSIQKYFKMERS